MFTAHYCVPPHCTDFTDGLNCVCFFGFANIIVILFYYYVLCIMYLLPCHGENKENKDYHCSLQSVCSSPVLSELLFTDEIFTKQFQAEIVRASDYETDSHAMFKSDLEFRLQEPLVSISTTFENCVIIRVSPIHILSLSHSTPCPEKNAPPP